MSKHFSCNQYEKEFKGKKLQNWEVPREYQERPNKYDGFTQIIANDRGHLFQDVKRGKESPWGNFVGTWDLPTKIPGNKVTNPTARSLDAQAQLRAQKEEADYFISGKMKDPKIRTPEVPMPSHDLPPAPPVGVSHRSGAEAPVPNTERPPSIKTPSPAPMQGPPLERLPSRKSASPVCARNTPNGVPVVNELNVPVATPPQPASPVPAGSPGPAASPPHPMASPTPGTPMAV